LKSGTSTWTICASTKKRRCAVPPDTQPVQPSTVLTAVQTAARRLRRWPAASLDRGCARRSAGGPVGTKGSVCSIEQRDASFDPGSASPPAMTKLLNFAHTTLALLALGAPASPALTPRSRCLTVLHRRVRGCVAAMACCRNNVSAACFWVSVRLA